METKSDLTLKLIITLLKNLKTIDINNYSISKKMYKYILNQTLRQLELPKSKKYLSKNAKELYNKVSKRDVFDYGYRDKILIENDQSINLDLYKGSNNEPYNSIVVNRGDKFIFRDVFHDDHIIPIGVIVNKLIDLKDINPDNIQEILNKISICRMLKSEDRKIKERKNRPYDEEEIIKTIYKLYQIEVERIA